MLLLCTKSLYYYMLRPPRRKYSWVCLLPHSCRVPASGRPSRSTSSCTPSRKPLTRLHLKPPHRCTGLKPTEPRPPVGTSCLMGWVRGVLTGTSRLMGWVRGVLTGTSCLMGWVRGVLTGTSCLMGWVRGVLTGTSCLTGWVYRSLER